MFNFHSMKQTTLPLLLALLLTMLASGCSTTRNPGGSYPDGRDYPFPRTEKEQEQREKDREKRDKEWEKRDESWGESRKGRDYPFSALNIPKGHLPPLGECKVWFPGKPPGHQPAPQSCASALRSAPPGAWVITHEGSRYKVNIFNRNKRNVIDEVRYYQTK